jgi:hypothetical protein
MLFLKLLSTFPWQMTRLLKHEFGTNCLKKELPMRWIFQEGYIEEEITTMQNL